jgi:tRNA A37 threonylcarbamoyladenosine modification protein TsaB
LILALDTSTAACTAALLERDGTIVASRDELIGRGHAERLVPMIEEMLDGHVPAKILQPGAARGIRAAG